MKTKVFGGIAIVAIALAVAFNVSLNTGKTNNASLLALANVEALASESSNGCPDFNYVPDRFIVSDVIAGKYTCTTSGKLTVGTTTLEGSYEKGKEYDISIENKNCSGKAKGACCDQRQVGAKQI